MRPFLAEFLKELVTSFDIIFYTAGVRRYAELCIQVLKKEMESKYIHEDKNFHRRMDNVFDMNKVISRDDKNRFKEGINSEEKRMEEIEKLR
jgi:hypothetical protein